MMRRLLPILLALLIAAPAAAGGGMVQLRVGQAVALGDVDLLFQGVESDSRCPMEVWCFWPGDAAVVMNAFAPEGPPVVFVLHTYYDWEQSHDVLGWTVALVGLSPYPSISEPIDPADYVATLQVAPQQPLPESEANWGRVKALYR